MGAGAAITPVTRAVGRAAPSLSGRMEDRCSPSAAPSPSASDPAVSASPSPSPSPSPSEETATETPSGSFDLAQIAVGDYSSAVGRWSSEAGGTLDIGEDRMEWRGSDDEVFARVEGLVAVPVGAAPPDGPAQVSGEQELTTLSWVTSEGGFSHGSTLAFLPPGSAGPVLGMEVEAEDDDRIIGLPGNRVGRLMPSDLGPYVFSRDGDAPAAAAVPTTDEDEDEADCEAPVEGAYACAGGPVPAEATGVTSVIESSGSPTATPVTPTGNIGCDIYVGMTDRPNMACVVLSWRDDPPIPPRDADSDWGYPILNFGDGREEPFFGGAKGDPFCFMDGACPGEDGEVVPAQVVEYGEVVHFEGFVCASAENGLTCWNAETGRGAFFNRTTFSTF